MSGSTEIAALTSAAIQLAVLTLVYLFRDNDTYKKFVANPKAYGSPIIAIANASTVVGGGMFLIVSQIGYDAGTYGIYLGLAYLFGLSIFAAFCHKLGDKLDGETVFTLNQLVARTYGPSVRHLFYGVNVAIYFMVLIAQFAVAILFLRYLAPTYSKFWLSVPLAASLLNLFTYPIVGGFRRDILADIFQFTVVTLGAVAIAIAIYKHGDIASWPQRLDAAHWTGMSYGLVDVFGTLLVVPLTFFVRADMWQRVGAARNASQARLGLLIAAVISFAAYSLFTLAGMAAYAVGIRESPIAIVEFLSGSYKGVLFGLVFGAFLAAVLSTADTYLNNMAIHATSLIWPHEKDGPVALRRIQKSSAVILCLAIVLAYFVGNVVDLFLGSFALLLIFFMPILGIWLRRWRSDRAAFWSITIALVACPFIFLNWDPKQAVFFPFLVSLFVYVPLCIFDRRNRKVRP
jgi:Na+/proline symporter